MVSLESPDWQSLRASAGGEGALAATLLRRLRAGDLGVLNELSHQLCHQFTVGETAYPAVPHLVAIAQTQLPSARAQILALVGMIEASRCMNPEPSTLREEWRQEYFDSLRVTRQAAAELLATTVLDSSYMQDCLATVAATQGMFTLAIYLFGLSDARDPSCPVCGEYFVQRPRDE